MAEPTFAQPDDDLPLTIRRDRDRKQRTQPAPATYQPPGMPSAAQLAGADLPPGDGPSVTVTALDIPFVRLMAFFIKAALAALPGLIVLGLILFGVGKALETFLPWLIKMRIQVTFH